MMPVTPNSNKPDDELSSSLSSSHPRSHSVSSGLQANESPSHQAKSGGVGDNKAYSVSPNPTDMQLKYENDRLKLALAQR